MKLNMIQQYFDYIVKMRLKIQTKLKSNLLLLSHFSHVWLCVIPQTAATRLSRPRDSPGKNTGVGCHFLLQCMKVKSEREVAQSCPTLSDPMDCSLPGSSIHGIFQAKYWSGVPLPLFTKSVIFLNHDQLLAASLVAQIVKNLPAMQETQVSSLDQEDPLEKSMATPSSILAWRSPWIEEYGGLQSMGSQRVGHDWVTEHL